MYRCNERFLFLLCLGVNFFVFSLAVSSRSESVDGQRRSHLISVSGSGQCTNRVCVCVIPSTGLSKECDLSKNPLSSSLHSSSNSFGHLSQPGSNNGGGSHCDPHNMHQDQVSDREPEKETHNQLILFYFRTQKRGVNRSATGRDSLRLS